MLFPATCVTLFCFLSLSLGRGWKKSCLIVRKSSQRVSGGKLTAFVMKYLRGENPCIAQVLSIGINPNYICRKHRVCEAGLNLNHVCASCASSGFHWWWPCIHNYHTDISPQLCSRSNQPVR